jgi:ABC transport system ATP-binding/permease protein
VPLLTADRIAVSFGREPLLDAAALQIEAGERIAVIGRNGTGKSTLLKILSGELAPDAGTIWRAPGAEAARLAQDTLVASREPSAAEEGRHPDTVFEIVAAGLGALRDLVVGYHHAVAALTDDPSERNLERLGRLQHELEEQDGWSVEQRVEAVLSRLALDPDARFETLSGGWRRRVLLARALVAQPAVLLLDEPTNHLDVETIEWLESFLLEYPGAIVFVTHDRAFLQRLATRIVELDRGRLTSWPGDYASFLDKKAALLENESAANAKFDKLLAQEEVWLRRGVKARRTRDEGRVKALLAMREARAARRAEVGNVRLQLGVADRSGQMVFEAERISKAYGAEPIVKEFSTRIMRGDRVGLIGPNGAGKTTLLRVLIGEIPPDAGEVRPGANVQVAYFDQQREQLDPEQTLVEAIGEGNETVVIAGQPRHVHGYLEDFLFPSDRARSKVKALSGGERSRLLLARLFTRPVNVLVLDEPTNDLDIETLELLEARLAEFPGTVLIVSHDRRFLDNVVTSTLAFEGRGVVREYVGGYEDWVRQRASEPAAVPASAGPTSRQEAAPARRAGGSRKKLTFNERRELEGLPARIEALEAEERALQERIGDPGFYREGPEIIRKTLARAEQVSRERQQAYARWGELDERS